MLALNRDSYPAIIIAPGDKVVYCAFDSRYSPELRGLVEGITREFLVIKQKARITRDEMDEPGLMTRLRQDYQDPHRRYLLVMNTQHRPRTLKIELEPGWQVEREDFHGLKGDTEDGVAAVRLAPREVFLFELVKEKSG